MMNQCESKGRPKGEHGKRIEIEMHYSDILVIHCHDHDGERKIYETKTEFLPGELMTFRKQNGFMYHAMMATTRPEQQEDEDERMF